MRTGTTYNALLRCKPPSPYGDMDQDHCHTGTLARVEGSVPPTSGFGIRRSPLSYTRIYTALKDGMLRVGSGFPGAWSSGRGFHQSSSPQLRLWCFVLPRKLLLFTAISAQWCRMRGATSRPGSWAGTTCGICPRQGVGAPSRGKEERR